MAVPDTEAGNVSGSSTPDWMKQWQALSQQSLGAWSEAARGFAGQPRPADGFEQGTQFFAPRDGAQAQTIERFVDGARSYVAMMQALLAGAGGAGGGTPAWADALRQAFAGNGGAAFVHPLAQQWQPPSMDAFGSLANLFRAPAAAPGDTAELKTWLRMPAFGLLREHQEHQQKTALAWVEYQEQLARYNTQMLEAARRGFEIFEGKLSEREQPGRQIESLRALYDLWVDAAEEGYAEIALSPEFQEIYGELTNAQMRMRSQIQQEVERLSVDLGMPTRSELDTIGKRLQEVRRELRALRGGDALIDEIAELRAEIETLRTAAQAAAPRPVKDVAEKVAVSLPRVPARAPAAKPGKAPARHKTAKPAAAKGKRPAKAAKAKRAVAAVAPGNFASRIAAFAGGAQPDKRALTRDAKKKAARDERGRKH